MATSSIQGIELITRLTQNGVATEFKSTRRCVSMDLVTVRPPYYIVSIFGGTLVRFYCCILENAIFDFPFVFFQWLGSRHCKSLSLLASKMETVC